MSKKLSTFAALIIGVATIVATVVAVLESNVLARLFSDHRQQVEVSVQDWLDEAKPGCWGLNEFGYRYEFERGQVKFLRFVSFPNRALLRGGDPITGGLLMRQSRPADDARIRRFFDFAKAGAFENGDEAGAKAWLGDTDWSVDVVPSPGSWIAGKGICVGHAKVITVRNLTDPVADNQGNIVIAADVDWHYVEKPAWADKFLDNQLLPDQGTYKLQLHKTDVGFRVEGLR